MAALLEPLVLTPAVLRRSEEPGALLEHIPALRRYALFLCQDRDRADDLVQECLTRAIANLEKFQEGTNLRAWLLAILRNFYFNNDVRRAGRERQWASEEEERANHPISVPAQTDAVALLELEQAMIRLPDEQREVVLLVGAEGMSYEEAAQLLALPIGTVRSRLSRARQRLLSLMGEGPSSGQAFS